MLPPLFAKKFPKGTRRIRASKLSVGDIIFLESAASADPVRSLILSIKGTHYQVMNSLNPGAYDVVLKDAQYVWALKYHKSTRNVRDDHSNDREWTSPVSDFAETQQRSKDVEEDFRSYWNWDPNDKRLRQEFHYVEEKDWDRLKYWWKKEQEKKKPGAPPAKLPECYTLLKVKAGVTPKQLKTAYRKAAFKYHPDRCKEVEAAEKFRKVTAAYQSLLVILAKK